MESSRPVSSTSGRETVFARALKTKMNKIALRRGFKNHGKKEKEDPDYKLLKAQGGLDIDKTSIPKVSEELNAKTVFEVVKAEVRPAEVKEKPVALKWKDGCKPAEEVEHDFGFEGLTPEMLAKNKDFVVGSRVMMEIRQHNMMEDVLGFEGNMTMRRFFEDGLDKPSQQVLDLLHKAMDLCYNRIVFYNDDFDMIVDAEMRQFLVDKDRAKLVLLDVMMMVPDFIPLNWGGKQMGNMLCDDPEAMNRVVAAVVPRKGTSTSGCSGGGGAMVPAIVTGPLAVPHTILNVEGGTKDEQAKKDSAERTKGEKVIKKRSDTNRLEEMSRAKAEKEPKSKKGGSHLEMRTCNSDIAPRSKPGKKKAGSPVDLKTCKSDVVPKKKVPKKEEAKAKTPEKFSKDPEPVVEAETKQKKSDDCQKKKKEKSEDGENAAKSPDRAGKKKAKKAKEVDKGEKTAVKSPDGKKKKKAKTPEAEKTNAAKSPDSKGKKKTPDRNKKKA